MKFRKIQLSLMVLVAQPAFSCGPSFLMPGPGQCTVQFIEMVEAKSVETSDSLNQLADRVIDENNLLVKEVNAALNWQGARSSVDLIPDQSARNLAIHGTALGLADRVTALRPRMTAPEWKKVVKLWARSIRADSKALRSLSKSDICTPGESAVSIEVNLGYIILSPIYIPAGLVSTVMTGKLEYTGLALAAPIAAAVGAVSDVALFVPQTLARPAIRLLSIQSQKHAVRAAQRFASVVFALEKKYGAASESSVPS